AAICSAMTLLIAAAFASSRMPFSSSQLSKVEPTQGFILSCSLCRHLLQSGTNGLPTDLCPRVDRRQTGRPVELHFGDVASDRPLILARQFVQPVPYLIFGTSMQAPL